MSSIINKIYCHVKTNISSSWALGKRLGKEHKGLWTGMIPNLVGKDIGGPAVNMIEYENCTMGTEKNEEEADS